MELVAVPLVLIALVLYIAWPLLDESPETGLSAARSAELEATRVEKDNLVESLKDLEMDYRMGKLSEEDYRALSTYLEGEALRVLKRLEALEEEAAAPVSDDAAK